MFGIDWIETTAWWDVLPPRDTHPHNWDWFLFGWLFSMGFDRHETGRGFSMVIAGLHVGIVWGRAR